LLDGDLFGILTEMFLKAGDEFTPTAPRHIQKDVVHRRDVVLNVFR
jgi:hypothetical protein